MNHLDKWYLENLVCPKSKTKLSYINNQIVAESGDTYPVIDGTPVMLIDDIQQTIELAYRSLSSAKANLNDEFHVCTIGISDNRQEELAKYIEQNQNNISLRVDPIVQFLVAETNGMLYRECVGSLQEYPIPEIRLPSGVNELLLDVGCSWGRWSFAAAKNGYDVVGIDPSLGAVLAAKRVSDTLGLKIKFVVGDARYLPFKEKIFDRVFSYSVLQHFSKSDARAALGSLKTVLKPGGKSLIQMPNAWGIRSLQHQFRRGFREAENFEVRYWSTKELHTVFSEQIGNSSVTVDGFLGLGIQGSDIAILPNKYKIVVLTSDFLRKISNIITPLRYFADSLYVESVIDS